MQLRPWLAVSLILNAGLLLALVWMQRGKVAAVSASATSVARNGVAASAVAQPKAASRGDASLVGLRDALRAAGVAPDQIEQVLLGMMQKQRFRAKRASSWWKGTPYGGDLQFADPMEMHEDRQELRRLMEAVSSPAGAAGKPDLDYVPEAKRAEVARILRDYAEISARHMADGMRLSSDMKRDDLLRAELKRDLRAVLTEAEYFEYTLHDPHAMEWVRLRMDAASLGLTESEFRETARELANMRAVTDPAAQPVATDKILADLRTKIGADRIFDARARNSHEFYQLREAQVRFGFPQTATDRVVEAWHRASRTVETLRAAGSDKATRAAGWRALAAETRQEVVAALGTEAGNAYMGQSMLWLHDWERGEDTRWAGMMGKK